MLSHVWHWKSKSLYKSGHLPYQFDCSPQTQRPQNLYDFLVLITVKNLRLNPIDSQVFLPGSCLSYDIMTSGNKEINTISNLVYNLTQFWCKLYSFLWLFILSHCLIGCNQGHLSLDFPLTALVYLGVIIDCGSFWTFVLIGMINYMVSTYINL